MYVHTPARLLCTSGFKKKKKTVTQSNKKEVKPWVLISSADAAAVMAKIRSIEITWVLFCCVAVMWCGWCCGISLPLHEQLTLLLLRAFICSVCAVFAIIVAALLAHWYWTIPSEIALIWGTFCTNILVLKPLSLYVTNNSTDLGCGRQEVYLCSTAGAWTERVN